MKNNIRILVISDTHRNTSNAISIIDEKKPDYVLHLGDHSDDADELRFTFPRTEIIGVSGNCDWATSTLAPTERMLNIDGVKVFMCHGHIYSVKSSIERCVATAKGKGADVVLFGHTHTPLLDNRGDIVVMNPGSVSTYGWIEISDGKIDARMCSVEE